MSEICSLVPCQGLHHDVDRDYGLGVHIYGGYILHDNQLLSAGCRTHPVGWSIHAFLVLQLSLQAHVGFLSLLCLYWTLPG